MAVTELGKFIDEPRCFIVIVKQKITCAQAQKLGSVLGAAGFQGDFLSGATADILWKSKNEKPDFGGEG
ncbi:hypothetical protein [Adlercreutzia shanghongiae]|uniref:Uncharacterized protein n=1 Tax=Adlercreutzia shanghongiae TaxID=3111773 RepID=A0ABU6IWE5_9ACTN|nr:hypothetical protein [Adlercreutzia sp. R22]MEC4294020.1 hypothetical protein [Adlercreutzia sp. R22]